ncbi:hypothetical protein GCM10009712_37820 [Pseudarthrobacter sulfonivorans]|uniref:nuclear transport factor 2 family protein n=1 Tax=Pseudarthrobacter sulfonivorans TaxID=121292 RepID=UPI00168B770E|nr:hypothetical protein [Pseudarthrobacter sulfonivorans]
MNEVPNVADTAANSIAVNKKVVTQYIAAYSDLTGVTSEPLLHSDAKIMLMSRASGLPFAESYTKHEYLDLFPGMSQVLPEGIVHKVCGMIAEDDWVAVETECFANLPNGRQYNNLFHFAIRLSGGQIIEIREYCDFLHVQQELFSTKVT